MDAKTAVHWLRPGRHKMTHYEEELEIADLIEQQAKQIEEMKCCTNCKHGGGRWCELEGCINLNKWQWDGGSSETP